MELITSQYAKTGHLITFAQFAIITLIGLRKQLYLAPSPTTTSKALSFIVDQIEGRLRKKLPNTTPTLNILFIGCSYTQTSQFVDALKDLLSQKQGFTCNDSVATTGKNQDPPSFPLTVGKAGNGYLDIILESGLSSSGEAIASKADVVIDFNDIQNPVILEPRPRSSILFNPLRLRLKRRHIPLTRHIVQVVLFLVISLLNNAAFAFQVPMPVHIIFRSAGLVVNLVMGWLIDNKR